MVLGIRIIQKKQINFFTFYTRKGKKGKKKSSTIAVIFLFRRPLKIQKLSGLIRISQYYSTLIKVYVEQVFYSHPMQDLSRQLL